MSIPKWDEFSHWSQARQIRGENLRQAANTRRWSNRQHGTVYSRPIPMNSDEASLLIAASRNNGIIKQGNINDVFRFRLKFDPEPGTRLAADEGYADVDAIPLSSSPVKAARILAMLPTAISTKGYTGKIPKIGDKVTVDCFYALHTDSSEPSLETCIFVSIDTDELTPTSLHRPAFKGDVAGTLGALFDGNWGSTTPKTPPTTKVTTTPKTGASATSGSAASPAPPSPHPTSNLSSTISTADVNKAKVKLTWGQAGILYENGMRELLAYASAHEGGYNSVVGHGRTAGDRRGFWTAGGSSKIKAPLPGFPTSHTLTDFTLREIRDKVHPFLYSKTACLNKDAAGKCISRIIESTAIGGYQILKSTLCCKPTSALGQLKANHTPVEFEAILDLKFDKDTQNRLGVILAIGKRPILGNYVLGFHNNYTEAGQDFAKEWASIPLQQPWTHKGKTCIRGQSAYCKVGSNATQKARSNETGVQEVVNKMDACRSVISRHAAGALAGFYAANAATHTREPSIQTATPAAAVAALRQSLTSGPDAAVVVATPAAAFSPGAPTTTKHESQSPNQARSTGFIKTAITTVPSADLGTKENPGVYGIDWISVNVAGSYRQKSLHNNEYWPAKITWQWDDTQMVDESI